MDKSSKIYIAGHNGTAGSAILSRLKAMGYVNILTKSSKELDLRRQSDVEVFLRKEKPEYIFLTAAKMSGMLDQTHHKGELIYDNIMIQSNIIHGAYLNNVKKMIICGSGSMYPRRIFDSLKEEDLMKGLLEKTRESYGLAKIVGAVMCESYNIQYNTEYFTLAFNNLYGNNMDFNFRTSRVIPALIRKFYLAKLLHEKNMTVLKKNLKLNSLDEIVAYLNANGIHEDYVEIWGSGKAKREFIHADDLADVCIFIMRNISYRNLNSFYETELKSLINVGNEIEYTIYELASIIKNIVGFCGKIHCDLSKPDTSVNRVMNCSKIHSLGWKHKIELEDGIKMMYEWYLKQEKIRS
ncbi:NAD-dependent epimerase/dehydratase family protein [Campylobacter peloridis]|uniref:NAD-dependent epimerase/dehydratase family protein n=1 Tax=Campylobacter peloridis TaxID=488546 RepID=UPI001C72F34B|nr:NAD-dependent epimerase/dehydratase family protein [Campylobacter peloridis]MBX1885403.1 NAD-dependent epimerase/dehydratase family protein [Campylobacter peloridis]